LREWSKERQKCQLRIKLKHHGNIGVRLERHIEENLDADSLGNPIGRINNSSKRRRTHGVAAALVDYAQGANG